MGKWFDDPLLDLFAWRGLAWVSTGGAEVGECIATFGEIDEGDADCWHRKWCALAERLVESAQRCSERGHHVSAREAYLRASNYFHLSYFPLFSPEVPERLLYSFSCEESAFRCAAQLLTPPVEPLEISFEGTTLPGYFIKVDNSSTPRPTIVHTNGYDSNIQEMYFAHAAAANSRGYHCLLFDGPGQGRNLIRDNMPMRPNWESVVTPVIDYLLRREDVDKEKIVLSGWSFGGHLAPRAAAFENRIAALIVDPGEWDQRETLLSFLPLSDDEKKSFPQLSLAKLEQLQQRFLSNSLIKWRLMDRNFWVHGANSLQEYFNEVVKFEISPHVGKISCPVLVCCNDGDSLAGKADKLFAALPGEKVLLPFTAAEGAGDHCQQLTRRLYHQRVFDALDECLNLDSISL